MPSSEDALLELVGEAAEVFEWEDLQNTEADVEIVESEDFPYPYCDILRTDSDEVYRLFVTDGVVNLNEDVAEFFDHYRTLEGEYEETEPGAILVWRAAEEEAFWYMRRTEAGDIGLFHSDLSLEEDDEEEEGSGNGKGL
jgi:hypothetical protein